MTSPTKRDVIEAAMSIADDAAQGRMKPSDLAQQAVTECRELFGAVAGPDDPLWSLHVDIARQVLALDGVPADELAEWLAVARQGAGEPLRQPDPAETVPDPEPESFASGEPMAEDVQREPTTEPVAEPEPGRALPRRADGYDPLAGWSPGRIRR